MFRNSIKWKIENAFFCNIIKNKNKGNDMDLFEIKKSIEQIGAEIHEIRGHLWHWGY